jgi:copper chaperone CopZ
MKLGVTGLLVAVGAVAVGAVSVGAAMQYGGCCGPVTGLVPAPAAMVVDGELQHAGMQTVTLKVDGMWCPSCGYIVHEALMATPGVVAAKVGSGSAEVTFDPSKAALADVIAATSNYGYPAELVSG